MSLSIETDAGQITYQQERRVIAAFHTLFPKLQFVETNKQRDAVNDGVVFDRKSNTLISVVETKCRGASLADLERWNMEWLITWEKVKRCAAVAREMRVLFVGLLYLTKSDTLLMVKIYDGHTDKWLVKYRKQETETQRNVSGGTTIRMNAFIDMRGATRVPMPRQ
jgi:hypothetical protein